MAKAYRVTINANRYIPFLKVKGPVLSPLAISEGVYNELLKLGYNLVIHTIVDDTLNTHHIDPSIEVTQGVATDAAATHVEETVVESSVSGSNDKEIFVSQVEPVKPEIVKEVIPVEVIPEKVDVPAVEDTSEELEVEVYTREQYEAMSKEELVKYLNSIKDALPEDVQPFNNKSKANLLKIINDTILE